MTLRGIHQVYVNIFKLGLKIKMEKIENKAASWFEKKIFRKEFFAGGAAGLTAILSSYPFE